MYPVVVIGHGTQLSPSQYYGYAQRLASFGYIAMTVNFPTNLSVDHPGNARDLLGGVDFALSDSRLVGMADAQRIGVAGHSLGGKVALLAATYDARVKAAFLLDPLDEGSTGCNPPNCVVVKNLMPSLHIPTGFIGETSDTSCAPTADNFLTFYAGANTPSLSVTANGANHVSFLDDVATCGFTCSVCNAATAPNAQVNGMARALMVAFFERYLRQNAAYDTWLTGAQAQSHWVTTTQATITSK